MNTQEIFNIDLLNALRLYIHGVDVEHMEQNILLPDDLYNAIEFAHANPLAQFTGCPEWQMAVDEFTIEIVGSITF